MVTFAWPWILALLPLPLALGLLHSRPQAYDGIAIPPRLNHAFGSVANQSGRARTVRLVLLWLAWIALLFALSQPAIPSNATVQPASGRTLMLAIDLSSSMERKDFVVNNKAVDRLTVVKQIANEFILNRSGDRVGLVLFSTDTFVASPPSFDLASIAHTLASSGIGMAGRTTAIGDAIGMAISSLRSDPAPEKAIVLLSDGTNNAGSVEPESAARLAQQLGIAIHTIGLGSENLKESDNNTLASYTGTTADLDEATLESIADISGGQFFRATTTKQLADVYAAIDKLEGAEAKPPPIIVRQQISPLFIFGLLLIAFAYFVLQMLHSGSRL